MLDSPEDIHSSKVSVYEIELDLNEWKIADTRDAPEFCGLLLKILPILQGHTCATCRQKDFMTELEKGTNFAHVIEHVVLGLINATSTSRVYTGWTRVVKNNHVYVIHYGAPDFLTGRLAAILSIDLVKRLINQETVDADQYLKRLKKPLSYFNKEDQDIAFHEAREPISVIQELRECASISTYPATLIELTDEQIGHIRSTFIQIRESIEFITEAWRTSFLLYSGNFGKAILDKMELLNIDHFLDLVIGRNVQGVAWGIKKASQVVSSYHIPVNFVIHSLWLYKNKLLSFIMEKYKYRESAFTDQIIKDFEDFYQLILQSVMEGYHEQTPAEGHEPVGELRKFVELKGQAGYILIVDDDEIIRRALKDILEYHGYQTIIAQNGAQGLEILNQNKNDITLVILDVFLRDYQVEEIYPHMMALCPAVKVLFISGYSISKKLEEHLDKGRVDFLMKPFTDSSLINRIHSLLS
jgi:CheY-like chemotaxis protein